MTRGVFYLLTGPAHAVRLVVSLWSLRKHFNGPVTVYTTQPESHAIGEQIASDSRVELYDTYGHMNWAMDERGFITNQDFDLGTGALLHRIDDCNGSLVTLPSGWSTPAGGGLNLVTDYQIDDLGRTIQTLGPPHDVDGTTTRTARWTVYQDLDDQVWSAAGFATGSSPSYTYTLVNPVSINSHPQDGLSTSSIQATRASTSGKLISSDTFAQSTWVRLSVNLYNKESQQTASRVYHDIPSSGDGTLHTNYEETTYDYDEMNRQNRVESSGGTISRSVYDVRSLLVSSYVGTDDTGATNSDPTGGGAMGNNMKPIVFNEYDGGADGGDGNLTETTQPVDDTSGNDRVTAYAYDFRNRQITLDGEVDLYIENTYDNLNRVTRVDRYDTTQSSSNLVARQDTAFDDRGRTYLFTSYAVEVGSGTVGNSLVSNSWFDASGNPIKQVAAGAKDGKAFGKMAYDGIGRQIAQYIGYYTESGDEPYSEVGEITSDNKIFSQSFTTYDDASNVIQQTSYQRFHDATGNGELDLPTGGQPKARVIYVASWYDGVGRMTAMANYGTNAESALSRPSSAPSSSDTVLVTLTEYNSRGEAFEVTDPSDTITHTEWDDAGRRTTTIENYDDGGPVNSDTNVTTEFAYNADSRLETLTAINATTGNQTTTYDYGVTLSGSEIASNDLLASETYPDSVDGSDKIFYEYNRQGQRIELTDQNGSVHEYDYDKLGRLLYDCVITVGSGVDNAVRRLGLIYEPRGLVEKTTSYNNATVGSGSIVNEVQNVYNDFQQLIIQYQAHSGAVNTGSTPSVQYDYEDGSANSIRLTQVTYPDGRELNYDYGTSGGDNDLLGRVEELQEP